MLITLSHGIHLNFIVKLSTLMEKQPLRGTCTPHEKATSTSTTTTITNHISSTPASLVSRFYSLHYPNRSWLSPKFHGSTLLSHGETALNRHLPQNDLATSTSNTSIINDHISSTTASIISKFYPLLYHNERWLSFKFHGLIPQTHGDMAFNSHPGTTSPSHQYQHHHPHLKSHLLNHSINLSEILPTSIS